MRRWASISPDQRALHWDIATEHGARERVLNW